MANNNWLHKSIHHIFRDLLAERKNRNHLSSLLFEKSREFAEIPPSRRTSASNPSSFHTLATLGRGLSAMGGRRCSPPGGFQSAAPPWWATACWTVNRHLRYDLEILLRNSSAKIRTPLSFSLSPGPPRHRKPGAKKRKSLLFSIFESIFSRFKTHFDFDIEKSSKNMRKTLDLGVPNPSTNLSKIDAKSMSQKTCHISLIFV